MKTSGILLPIFSLPSDYGIGCFSKEAYKFVDFLEEAGQKYWQILPLGTIGAGNSPYLSFSSFAGSAYYIDLEQLLEEGLLKKKELESIKENFPHRSFLMEGSASTCLLYTSRCV